MWRLISAVVCVFCAGIGFGVSLPIEIKVLAGNSLLYLVPIHACTALGGLLGFWWIQWMDKTDWKQKQVMAEEINQLKKEVLIEKARRLMDRQLDP